MLMGWIYGRRNPDILLFSFPQLHGSDRSWDYSLLQPSRFRRHLFSLMCCFIVFSACDQNYCVSTSLSYVLLSLCVKMADGCHGDAEVGPNLLIKANKHPTFRLYLPWVLTSFSLIDLSLPEASPYIDVTACGERLIISWGVTYFCTLSMEITPICHI